MTTTWNPANVFNANLSGGNLTFAVPGASEGDVEGTSSHAASGIFMYEYVCNGPNTYDAPGFANTSWAPSLTTNDTNCVVVSTQGDGIYNGPNLIAAFTPVVGIGGNLRLLVNIGPTGAKSLFVSANGGPWNNNANANPIAGSGGVSLSVLGTGALFPCAGGVTAGGTVNFGASPFINSLPAGATAWDAGVVVPLPGLLGICTANPRYAGTPDGNGLFLSGSHTWNSLQNIYPTPLDFSGYVNWMKGLGHNFMRLWRYDVDNSTGPIIEADLLPYQRTGPGNANDGGLKFDLTKFNQPFFDRIRARVIEAGQSGIYVSIQLFDGWNIVQKPGETFNPWPYSPFKGTNNINGIAGDPHNTGGGLNTQDLSIPAITTYQENFAKKIVDTVNDLTNVVYEIENEGDPTDSAWQEHMITTIQTYEAGKPNKHLVWRTWQYPNGNSASLFSSAAPMIALGSDSAQSGSSPADFTGNRIVVNDSDHIDPVNLNGDWVWKQFMRGVGGIVFMDDLNGTGINGASPPSGINGEGTARPAMGQCVRLAGKLSLKTATPHDSLSSTGYCLANPGQQYSAYSGNGGTFTLNLSAASGVVLNGTWFDAFGTSTQTTTVTGGNSAQPMTSPFGANAAAVVLVSGSGTVTGSGTPATPDDVVVILEQPIF